jgi:hypothetical protein
MDMLGSRAMRSRVTLSDASPKSGDRDAARVVQRRRSQAGDLRPCRSASGRSRLSSGAWGAFEAEEDGKLGSPGDKPDHEPSPCCNNLSGDVDDRVDERAKLHHVDV